MVSKSNAVPYRSAQNALGGKDMGDFGETLGAILLFLGTFLGCVVWATHGHPSDADNEDLSVVAKDH